MKKLLNTVYVTSEGATLRKDGENLVAEVEGEGKKRAEPQDQKHAQQQPYAHRDKDLLVCKERFSQVAADAPGAGDVRRS